MGTELFMGVLDSGRSIIVRGVLPSQKVSDLVRPGT